MTSKMELPPINWRETTVLITGGTGSLGKTLTRLLLTEFNPRSIRIYSRDELKQWNMRQEFDEYGEKLSFLIGDVRDQARLQRAMEGVDLVFHAAAMKQVPACEYNPLEAIKTNVLGAQNVLDSALNAGVTRIMNVTTDKAVNPVNLYGASKLCAEKIFVHGNSYAGHRPIAFANCRYGNVIGSRGSVVPLFREQKKSGRLTVTDVRMTRFWITLHKVTRFLVGCAEVMRGGEIFVPKMPTTAIVDLAKAIAPECSIDVIGIRPGEKLHECLITVEESRNLIECEDMFIILTNLGGIGHREYPSPDCRVAQVKRGDFSYASDTNDVWLSIEEIQRLIREADAPDGVVRHLHPVKNAK